MSELYEDVNDAWGRTELPPITRLEAARAAMRIRKHYGFRSARVRPDTVRRCWMSPRPSRLHGNGWWRLVHDMSHSIFDATHRGTRWARGHSGFHSRFELDMIRWVVEQGWLDGKLKPKTKPKAPVDLRAIRYQRIVLRERQWQSRAKRAVTMLRKLRRQRRYYERQQAA